MQQDNKGLMLNIGCGKEKIGDVRLDFAPTPGANIVGDAQHLPFQDNVFTKAYERNVLEHMPNPGQHLEEVKRVLKLGGLLTLITDNAACLKYYLFRTHMGGYSKYEGKDRHYALFTPEHIRNLMWLNGLDVQKLEFIDTTYFTQIFDYFIRFFMPSLSYPRILVEARKN